MRQFYKSLFFIIIMAALFPLHSKAAESFVTTGVVADSFPMVKVYFLATDNRDSSFKDLQPSDFEVIDNGQDVSEYVTIECVLDTVVPEVSVVMVLDKSSSMELPIDPPNPTDRWTYVKQAAKLFINTLRFVKDTKVAITSFSKNAYLQCNFTNNKDDLFKGIDTVDPYGDTMYNPPFLDEFVGAINLLKNRPPDIRRIVVFLTDGAPNMSDPPKTKEIIDLCNVNNIQVYCVTLQAQMHISLIDIATGTGGNSFEVHSSEELSNIYKLIAIDIQMKQICSLNWISPYGCDENDRVRQLSVTCKRVNKPTGIRRDQKYTAPPQSVATVDLSEKILSFGDPAIGVPVKKQITLTPRRSPLYVSKDGVEFSTSFFSIDWNLPENKPAPPFVIDTNTPRTFTVQFIQSGSKQYRQAAMMFKGTPCPPTITLVGGYNQIIVVSPNGDEIYSTCDSIDITWAGIDPITFVNLSYSTNSGVSWLPIVSNIRGSSYKWLPPSSGTRYKIRANVAPVSSYMCAHNAGGTGDDVANSIAVQTDNLYFYVTGHFEDKATFQDKEIQSEGSKDLFIAKYDRECNLVWVESAGGSALDTAAGIVVDENNNTYITGVCYNNAKFGSMGPSFEVMNVPYCFTAKVSPNGTISKVELIGATGPYTGFQATGQKIRYKNDGTSKEIIVQGYFKGELRYLDFYINDPNWNRFTATYDMDLTLKSLVRGAAVQPGFSTDEVLDGDGNKYKCGSFSNQIKFDTFTLNSNGKTDIYINKFGGTPGSDDQSDKTFIVDSPKLTFKEATMDLGDVIIGSDGFGAGTDWLKNNGTIPVEITYYKIVGPAASEFSYDQDRTGSIIQPGEEIDLPINFIPTTIGLRTAQLVIKGTCVDTMYLNLIGNGICSAEVVPLVDMGNVNAGEESKKTITCIFKNTNNETINIDPKIEPAQYAGDYKLTPSGRFPVAKGQCVEMEIVFKPTLPGSRNAFINFNMPEECENPKTELHGSGVDANLEILPIDFGRVLVKRKPNAKIKIENKGLLDLNITNAVITDQTDNIYTLDPINFPLVVPKNDTREITVNFQPQDELVYNNSCKLTFSNGTEYNVGLTGEGYLPKLVAEWICDKPTTPGTTSIAELKLTNPSKSSETKVNLVKFNPNNSEFKWDAGVEPSNITLEQEGSITIPVKFEPVTAGQRQTTIVITSNAFDGTHTGEWIDTQVDAQCEGLSFTFANPFQLGTMLLCDELIAPLEISNDGWRTPITILSNKVTITGNDASAFEVLMPGDLTINGGETKKIDISFTPTEERDYSAVLNLVNSLDLDLKVTLKGRGETVKLYTDNSKEGIEPGENRTLPFKAKISELADRTITSMKIIITYDSKTLKFENETFTNLLPAGTWVWDTPQKTNGNIIITGAGELQTPFEGELFSIRYTIYLGDTKKTDIKARVVLDPCVTNDLQIQEAELANVCFIDGRLIKLSNTMFSLAIPEPNPAVNEFTLEYGIAYQAHTTIEIVNSHGDKVMNIMNGTHKAGLYEAKIPVTNLSSGLYLLRMNSGPFTKTIPFVIAK